MTGDENLVVVNVTTVHFYVT